VTPSARAGWIELEPDDLGGFYRSVSSASGRERSLSMERIHLGPDTLLELPEIVTARGRPAEVALVVDDRPMCRDGADLKPLVASLLTDAGLEVRPIVLSDPHGLHTTAEHVERLARLLEPTDTVVSVGSGTITDLAKHAVFTREQVQPGRRGYLVSVATANSVGAYTSQLAVVTTHGVKRTVPSRLPDRLVLDTRVLASTPEEYSLGGVGDAAVGCCSLADYRLASWCGLGRWEPLSRAVFLPGLTAFLDRAPAFTAGGLATAGSMARNLAAAGFAMSFAGESAPASGLEHVTSHMLDMTAAHHDRPIGNHGEQCGLATALVLLAYRHLLTEFDPRPFLGGLPPVDVVGAERLIGEVFGELDPTGAMAAECWSDYSAKCAAWVEHAPQVLDLLAHWDERRPELAALAADPQRYLAALAATGHPLAFEDVPPGLTADEVRWAFGNARLMRRRLSVADFLGFLGLWTDGLVDRILADFEGLRRAAVAAG
jgi:glycerol-1-phosphate dehydrogenase [NAD(P)+]